MIKKWWDSKAILGGIATALGYLAKPETLDLLRVLPLDERARNAVASISIGAGIFLSIFGIRRAIPDASAAIDTKDGKVTIHDPSGKLNEYMNEPRNQWGETKYEQEQRETSMKTAGEDLRRTLEAREGGRAARRPEGG